MQRKEAHSAVSALLASLTTLIEKDPEMFVSGAAVSVLAAVVTSASKCLPGHPIVEAIRNALLTDSASAAVTIRVADALVIAEQLREALYEAPGPLSTPSWL